ncbi:hypothetical protein [Flavobacterium suzhouense]|uniref:Uncharacterized protein n=1 Tax=Flavobacterium suzhouense TaxID=1529638 RepID=A0ABW5NSJ0_9FLAO
MGKAVADTLHTPMFDRHAYNWARERYKATKDSSGVYHIGIYESGICKYAIISGNIGKLHGIIQQYARLYLAFIKVLEGRIDNVFSIVVNVYLC